MKILFVDVDGVLNTDVLIRSFGCEHICPDRVLLLKKIVDATDAHIVLSSTWRINPSNRRLVSAALSEADLRIIDCTPILTRKLSMYINRHQEISSWLNDNAFVTKYAIIDDLDDACIPGDEASFFKTSAHDSGLTDEIAVNIIKHLNS